MWGAFVRSNELPACEVLSFRAGDVELLNRADHEPTEQEVEAVQLMAVHGVNQPFGRSKDVREELGRQGVDVSATETMLYMPPGTH